MTTAASVGFELSAQQKRLWELQGQMGCCCVQHALRIDGGVQAPRLARAIRTVMVRHEILRTTFHRRPGRLPLQVIAPTVQPGESVLVETGGGSSPPDLDALLARQRTVPFDLAGGPPLRAELVAGAAGESYLLLTLSALCGDGASLLRLAAEIASLYPQRASGAEAAETDEPLQYVSYSAWQQELASGEDPETLEGLAYWRRHEPLMREPVELPWERTQEWAAFQPAIYRWCVAPAVRSRAEAAARRYEASLADVLLAAWAVLVWRSTGKESFVVGNLQDGRKLAGLQEAVGAYAAYLPLRCDFRGDRRFCDVLAAVRDAGRKSRGWEELGPGYMASLDPPPSFAVGFDFVAWPAPWEVGGISFSLARRLVCAERLKAHLTGCDDGSELRLELLTDRDLLAALDVRSLAEGLSAVLGSAVLDPEARVDHLATLQEAARHRLLIELNDSEAALGDSVAIHRLFEAQAAALGSADAVVYEERRLSYAELDARANRLAHYLRARGVGPESTVALLLDRSPEMVVGLLGTLKAGGAYVPLDVLSPTPRLRLMLDEVQPRAILTQEMLADRLPADARGVVRIDADWPAIAQESPECLPDTVDPASLLYVLFTSGSTGRPKGVAIEHRQMLNYLRGILDQLDVPPRSSFVMVSTFGADLGNTALFPSLCSGGCLHILSEERAMDSEGFAEYMRRRPLDLLKIVPSHLASLLAAGSPGDSLPRKYLVLGGEDPPMDLVQRIGAVESPPAILNEYGPTETTVGIGMHRWQGGQERERGRLPLGRPLANYRIYLLGCDQQPVAAGVPGELYVGGLGLARGYFGRPDLTAERFVPDSLSGEAGSRLYRTGDLARYLVDGSLMFLGRIDHQHKIRGFRVETGEIEVVLRQHAKVREAVVVVREDPPRGRRLVAYVVPRRGQPPESEDLRTFLRAALPEHMVPAVLMLIKALPLNVNGKVDRSSLPVPEAGEKDAVPLVPPRTAPEERLLSIWSEVLGRGDLGVAHNFFRVGGDSILAIQVIAKARQAGIWLSPHQLFRHQTIGELAAVARIVGAMTSAQEAVTGPVPLTPIQHWFFEAFAVDRHHWNQALAFEVGQPLDAAKLRVVFHRLVEHHDALRTRFTQTQGAWSQSVAAPAAGDADAFSLIDLTALAAEACPASFTAAASRLQASFDLERGPLVRLALFTGPHGWQRLFLVAHHLVIDGVSWRILLADLVAAYQQMQRGETVELPRKTTSFKRWAEYLAEQVRAGAFSDEGEHWREAREEV
ncbi:MAG TPA: amino acid adenylation domain-containing protein, partial [Thermoanaerobaculia bacterium]